MPTRIDFLDASSIADMARDRPPMSKTLALAENPISTDTSGGYIGVVRLDEYQRFITDRSGKLNFALFEANVRDYEGETGVNQSIQATLERPDDKVDFWWLNNGVTIVADKVQLAGKLLELESPQVVTGLQTSHEIFKRDGAASGESRSVLVKVIQAAEDDVKDRIIRATNSQTTLGVSALRATDKVQRQIEEHLGSLALFYERRKNYYHNRSIPLQQLVSIDQMGQALLSALVQVPHVARGELSRIFEGETYDLLFASTHPIKAFSAAIHLLRHCEDFLRSSSRTRDQAEDFVFHLTMLAAMAQTGKRRPNATDLAVIDPEPSDSVLATLLALARTEFAYVADRRGGVLFDRVAKDELTTQRVIESGSTYLKTRS